MESENTVFNPGYYNTNHLRDMNFKSVGENVQIGRNCIIVGLENITLGSNIRIDGLTTIVAQNGQLVIGDYVHIGGSCHLTCASSVTLESFSGLSQGVRIYSATDDYSGGALTNPTVPREFTNVKSAPVTLRRHVIIGSGSVILPGVEVGEGSSVGALSLVTRSLASWGVFSGCPARKISNRSNKLLEMEQQLLSQKLNGDK